MIRINLLKPKLYLPANEYCCERLEEHLKLGFISQQYYDCFFVRHYNYKYELPAMVSFRLYYCPFCGANLRGE